MMEHLQSRALELAARGRESAFLSGFQLTLTYKDVDGDACVLLSNSDVLDALKQYQDADHVKMFVSSGNSTNKDAPTAATQTPPLPRACSAGTQTLPKTLSVPPCLRTAAPLPLHQLVDSILQVLATVMVALQAHLQQQGGARDARDVSQGALERAASAMQTSAAALSSATGADADTQDKKEEEAKAPAAAKQPEKVSIPTVVEKKEPERPFTHGRQ